MCRSACTGFRVPFLLTPAHLHTWMTAAAEGGVTWAWSLGRLGPLDCCCFCCCCRLHATASRRKASSSAWAQQDVHSRDHMPHTNCMPTEVPPRQECIAPTYTCLEHDMSCDVMLKACVCACSSRDASKSPKSSLKTSIIAAALYLCLIPEPPQLRHV
jgi:hypothetical protein